MSPSPARPCRLSFDTPSWGESAGEPFRADALGFVRTPAQGSFCSLDLREPVLLHLPARVTRQRVEGDERARHLEGGELLAAPAAQGLRGEPRPRRHHHLI